VWRYLAMLWYGSNHNVPSGRCDSKHFSILSNISRLFRQQCVFTTERMCSHS